MRSHKTAGIGAIDQNQAPVRRPRSATRACAPPAAATAKGTPVHVGGIYSSDTFYDERADLSEQLMRHGCLGVEMEAAELYILAARHKVRALAVLTVSDHITTGEALPSDQRERSFGAMVEIALEAAFA